MQGPKGELQQTYPPLVDIYQVGLPPPPPPPPRGGVLALPCWCPGLKCVKL